MGMKGHPESNCNCCNSSSSGWMMKKKKMAMVVVVMVVIVMGVMVVQKMRDRRLFNLVIKDKDRQILSLHLLLQKEKQYAKESKRKNQDLNAKLFSLEADKIQLNNNIMELQSTITSMREEQRALELTIQSLQTPKLNQTIIQGKRDVNVDKGKQLQDLSKKEMHNTTTASDSQQKSQLKPNLDDPATTLFNSKNLSTHATIRDSRKRAVDLETKTKADRNRMEMDEDDASTNVSEADPDYKEDTDD